MAQKHLNFYCVKYFEYAEMEICMTKHAEQLEANKRLDLCWWESRDISVI